MKFVPKSEDDLKRESLLDPGTYDFEVVSAEDAVSKSGNEMIAIKLRIFSDRGERSVRDWLMPSMGFKLRHFTETTGMVAAYDAGTFNAEDCKGRTGRVLLKVETQEGYSPKNSVRDYEKAKEAREPAMTPEPKAVLPRPAVGGAPVDEIPFARFTPAETWG